MLIAKKTGKAIYSLIAVILTITFTVGCTFIGEKEEEFLPDTVNMVQMLSSAFPPDPITDAETVEYLWSVYQDFKFDRTTEELGKENVWSISVSFIDSKSGESKNFTIFAGGICWLDDDYETNHVLHNGDTIYEVFLSYYKAAQHAEPTS